MKASEDLLSRLYENTPLLKNTPLLPKGCDWKPKPGSSKRDAILDPSQAPGTYIHTYIHTYILTYLHTYILTYLHTYILTYLHTYIRTYLHTYILTYLHTYILTYITLHYITLHYMTLHYITYIHTYSLIHYIYIYIPFIHVNSHESLPQNPPLRPGINGLELPAKSPTVWPKGSTQEVAWAITANHGGGYSYRLCPKGGMKLMFFFGIYIYICILICIVFIYIVILMVIL